MYKLSPIQIEDLNKTDKNISQSSNKPLLLQYMYNNRSDFKNKRLLDFGSGKSRLLTESLQAISLNVDAYEIGKNYNSDKHVDRLKGAYYDVVFANNVLNYLHDEDMILHVLKTIRACLKCNGQFIANYPSKPRTSNLSSDRLFKLVSEVFEDRATLGGGLFVAYKF